MATQTKQLVQLHERGLVHLHPLFANAQGGGGGGGGAAVRTPGEVVTGLPVHVGGAPLPQGLAGAQGGVPVVVQGIPVQAHARPVHAVMQGQQGV